MFFFFFSLFCIDPVYVCAISLMCRFDQPLCIFLLQTNNSIFDRLFTNNLLHMAPPLRPACSIFFGVNSFAFSIEIVSNQILLQPSACKRTSTAYLSFWLSEKQTVVTTV